MPKKDSNKGIIKRDIENSFDSSRKGKNYLFVIAIDAYEYCPKLYNCVADATKLIEILTIQYNFEKQLVKTLFNEKATEGNIFKAFRELAQVVKAEDNLIIYFSGHGEYDKVFDEGYWIPFNAQLGAHEDFVPNSKIKTILGAIHSKHTFLIADSCFSGSLFTQFKSATVAERLENDPSRWGLTAGRNEVVSDGKPGDHSPFADSLLYHLKENKVALGVATLCNRVVENVVAAAEQTPRGEPLKVKGHRGGQFFFHPKSAFKAEPKKIAKTGSILYQIPDEMEVEKDIKCIVRIAFDKEILKKELDIDKESTIKSIRVSNLMEVDLIDPLAAGTFQIRAINETEQIIDRQDFTQWLFYVKAKKEGTFPLLLKVTVIELIYGKERKKELVLEETISVVSKIAVPLSVGFKNAGYDLALSAKVGNLVVNPELTKFDSGDESFMPSPAPPPPSSPIPQQESNTINPSKERKSGNNLFKIIGGIAAALLFFVFGTNIYMGTDKKPRPIQGTKPNQETNSGGGQEPKKVDINWKYRDLRQSPDGKGKFGFIDNKTKKLVIKREYDQVMNFNEEVTFVRKGKKWGLINKKGDIVVDFIMFQPGKFKNGVAEVDVGLRSGMVKINTKGQTKEDGKFVPLKFYVRKRVGERIKF